MSIIIGTSTADTLLGLAGDDTIFAWEGNDRIRDSSGNNIVNGNDGDDSIFGESGNNLLRGGQGNDTIYADKGDNTVFGDKGNDLIFVGVGNNVVNGNEGDDTIYGGQENDLLRGGKNHDLIFGNAGDDSIYGDWGADTIAGMAGSDIFVIGRIVNGVFKTTGGPQREDADVVVDFENGIDLISVTGGLSYADLDIYQGTGNDANNTIIKDKVTDEYLVVLLGTPSNSIKGTSFLGDVGNSTRKISGESENDAPVNMVPSSQNMLQNTRLIFKTETGNSISISDSDAGSNSVEVTLAASKGNLSLSRVDGVTFTSGNNNSSSMSLVGSIDNINLALDGLTFIPDVNFSGNASIAIFTNDKGYTGSGGSKFDRDTIEINVIDLNDSTKFPSSVTVIEDENFVFKNDNAISFQENPLFDSPIKITLSTSKGTLNLSNSNGLNFNGGNNGSGSMTFTGNVASINAAIKEMTFAPERNFYGNTSILILAEIDTQMGFALNKISGGIPVIVTPVNDEPVNTVPGSQTINQNETLVFGSGKKISIADIDAANNPVQVTLTANNGKLNLSKANGLEFNSGNNGDSNMTFSGTIENINQALGNLSFTPNPDFAGDTSIYIMTDDRGNTGGGNLLDRDIINISVIKINTPPVNTVPSSQKILQNIPLVFNTDNNNIISITDSDAGNNPVEVTLTTANGTLSLSQTNGLTFSSGTATNSSSITFSGNLSNINTALNGITFTPTNNFIGNTDISLTTNDLGNTGSGGAKIISSNIPITVGNANSIPKNDVPGKQVTFFNTPIIFNTISITDDDAGNNPIQVTLAANIGKLSLNGTTGLTFIDETANNSNSITFTGKISDINTALNGLSFTPKNEFKGDDFISITTNDLGNTGIGGPQFDTDEIPVTVNLDTVSITTKNIISIEEGNIAKFKLSRNGSVGDLPLSLIIDSSSTVTSFGDSEFPVDYTFGGNVTISSPNKMTVTIPDGKSSVDVIVNLNKDSHAEKDETLKLNLVNTGNYNITPTQNNSAITIKGGGTVVNSTKDDGSFSNYRFVEGTLRQAMQNANFNWGVEDTITFNLPEEQRTITLTEDLSFMEDKLVIDGPQTNKVTIDGNNQHRIFEVHQTNVTFNNLIVVNGKGSSNTAGGIQAQKSEVTVSNSIFSNNTSPGRGGAIHISSDSTLKVTDSSFDNNVSTALLGGGAISNNGDVIISNTAITNNSAFAFIGGGGGIANDGTMTINNSTIANNFGDDSGGGIVNGGIVKSGKIIINNSTIANNSASDSGGGIYNLNGTVTVSNTIIADNKAGSRPDFDGTLTSAGYNAIGNTAGVTIIGNTTGNILNKSAKLDSLKDNGGLTRTMALLSGSPAINAGDSNFNDSILPYDQRGMGFDRIFGGRLDIGAFESLF